MHRQNQQVFIGAPVRTPIGKFGGGLSSLTSPELGAVSATATINRAGIDPDQIDEVIIGIARLAGVGPNPARQIAFKAGCPETVPAYSINMACGSGLKSIISGFQTVALGDANLILAGGSESLSNAPYLLMQGRWGYRLGHSQVVDSMYRDGYLCPLCDEIMGETAENLAEKYGIPRTESDQYALLSQKRCRIAQENGRFADEIVPVEVPLKKGAVKVIDTDEHPRPETTLEGLARLEPVFKEGGTVHAGNASGITDGAATVLVFSEQKRDELNLNPVVRIVDTTIAGVDPSLMGIGPVPAVKNLLQRNNLHLSDIDLIELNEAFAVQVLACHKELDFDMDKVNVNGGAIALGHPTGCTGTRITVTLLHEMVKRDATLGLATLCVSGGMGVALLVERV
ncbi:MAG: thiolase family protein [bacterium]